MLGVVGNDIGEVTLVTIPFKRLDLRAFLRHGTPQIQKLVALFTDYDVGFYDALGAGRSIEFAYESGRTAIQMAGVPEHLTPILHSKQEVDIVSNQSDPATSEANFIGEATLISHLSKRRIKEKQEDLEEEYNELRQKLRRLKKDFIIEADSEVKFKLEKRIEEYEVKLQQIEEKLEHLETE